MNTNRLKDFILYNNIIPIAVAVMFVGGAGAFAAQTVVQETGLLGVAQEVDINPLMKLDVTGLDAQLEILNIVDTENAYEVSYQFVTYAAIDGVWQEVLKQDMLKVRNKSRFTSATELESYLNEELYEIIEQDRVFLTRVQKQTETTLEGDAEVSFASLLGDFSVKKPQEVVVHTEKQTFLQSAARVVGSIITISTGPVAQSDGTGNDVEGEVVVETNQETTEESGEASTSTDVVSTTTESVSTTTETTSTTTEPVSDDNSATTTENTSTSTEETASVTDPVATSTDEIDESVSTTTESVSTTTETTSTTTEPISDDNSATTTEEIEEEVTTNEEAADEPEEELEEEIEEEAVVSEPETQEETSTTTTIE